MRLPLVMLAGSLAFVVGAAAASLPIEQKGRAFSAPSVTIKAGDTLHFANNDEFIHQIFVKSPEFNFDSDEQPPGQSVDVTFPKAGHFVVQCQIHPKMHLDVTVQ